MGVLNVTPDSFSDGGRFLAVDAGARAGAPHGRRRAPRSSMSAANRPGPARCPSRPPRSRRGCCRSSRRWRRRNDALISIDTYRAETARLAVAAGAHIVNDVWGLQREPGIAGGCGRDRGRAGHHAYRPRAREAARRHRRPVRSSWRARWRSREPPAFADDQIVLDPGFGFAKETPEENLELMARFERTSRARLAADGRHLAQALHRRTSPAATPADRGAGTAATSVILRLKGAALFRVHDVAINRDALAIADAMLAREANGG